MDVSKMCTDSSDSHETSQATNSVPTLERDILPSLSQLPIYGTTVAPSKLYNDISLQPFVHSNSKSQRYRNLSPRELRTQYQYQYQLQHQHLKSYTENQHYENRAQYHPYQNNSSFTDASSSSASTPLPSLLNKRPEIPQPPSHLNLQMHLSPTTTAPTVSENNQLKIVIDQCTSIYEKIGKYRADPLRETERNKIMDEVYQTAGTMLSSLKAMKGNHIENRDTTMTGCASDDISSTTFAMDTMGFNEEQMPEPANEEYKMIRQARNLHENSRPKYRRRSKRSMIGQRCHSCNTSETPEWRRGPDGARTLCNACGLHYSKLLRKGSLTVQTHNYMIEETRRVPRAVQFPKATNTPSPTSATQTETTNSWISEIIDDDESK